MKTNQFPDHEPLPIVTTECWDQKLSDFYKCFANTAEREVANETGHQLRRQ